MQATKAVIWLDEGTWIGYLQDFPDYWTQGVTLGELWEHLLDLHRDLTSGEIPKAEV